LRTKWAQLHTNEVFFRDTANGFVTWAVASLLVVGVVTSAVTGGATQGAHAAGAVAGQGNDRNNYVTDLLFRPAQGAATATDNDLRVRGEATRILLANPDGSLSADDRAYLTQLVAAHTGLSAADAGKRVGDVEAREQDAMTKAKQAANAARKAVSAFMLFTAISMLIGAFIACAAAALGGQERDRV
jgi:hypothetical protein